MFDALKYTEDLEKVGLEPEQAKKLVQMVFNMVNTTFISRQDFELFKGELLTRLDKFEFKTEKRFEQVDARFEQIDARFEQMDKRFERIETRFSHMINQLHKNIEDLDTKFESRMKLFSDQIESRFELSESKMFIRLGALMVTSIGVCGVMVGLIVKLL